MRASEQKFPIDEVMYMLWSTKYQGFVASGNGWYDHEAEQQRYDNKTQVQCWKVALTLDATGY